MGDILVLNSGSSSIKFALFDENLCQFLSGGATEIGGASELKIEADGQTPSEEKLDLPNHTTALRAILARLDAVGIDITTLAGVGHRVVHGGMALQAACTVTDEVIDEIGRCADLAPLHNPHNLAAIRALQEIAPGLPQVACFDTAFHATNPAEAVRYALPDQEDMQVLRRYGFHGISYQGLVQTLREREPNGFPDRLLALHLGNGASLCAIEKGISVATTMGYSPIEGLTMGTRCGSIDANLVLHLASVHGIDETSRILNKESGLLGLGGHSDMRTLHADGSDAACFAIRHFCYWAIRHSGSMVAAMGGLDGIAFTGGIGENDAAVRKEILSGLNWCGVSLNEQENAANGQRIDGEGSAIPVWIIEAEEEKTIAAETRTLLAG